MPTLVACLWRRVEAIQPCRVPTHFGPATRLRRPESQWNQGALATLQVEMCPRTANSGLAVVWLFAGLRRDEIMRLRVGCVRWQEGPAGVDRDADPGRKICPLAAPVNKPGIAFTNPVAGGGGGAVGAGEAVRPPQPPWTDPKTGERVQVLFSHRGKRV